jgi:DNA primase large subunit
MSEDTTIHEAARYPWSVGARALLKQLDISLEEIDRNERALQRARQRLLDALDGAPGTRVVDQVTDELSELASFFVAKGLVDAVGSMFLRRRWATAEAKRAEYYFLKESDMKLALLAKRDFEWKINSEITHVGGREFSHSLHFADYVAAAAGFHEREWKLVNKRMVDGYVLLRKAETARVLAAYVDRLLLRDIKKVSGSFPPHMQQLREEVEGRVRSHTERIQQEMQGEITREAFPPCIKALLADMGESRPLSHIARFALTAFLLNVGVDVDSILELFMKSPDFREDLARYQIEHIAGLRGSTTYTSPGCAYMVSVRLCVNKDATCELIRHPLNYYRLRRRRLSKPKSS